MFKISNYNEQGILIKVDNDSILRIKILPLALISDYGYIEPSNSDETTIL